VLAPSPKASWSISNVFSPLEEAWDAAHTPVYPAPTTTKSKEVLLTSQFLK